MGALCAITLAGCAAETGAEPLDDSAGGTTADGANTAGTTGGGGASSGATVTATGSAGPTGSAVNTTGDGVTSSAATSVGGTAGSVVTTADSNTTTSVTSDTSGTTTSVGGTGGTTPIIDEDCEGATTLREAARCTGRPIGVALRDEHLDKPEYVAAAREFDYVTAEDEMKWDATEPSKGQFDFSRGDAILNFAIENDMMVKGHTLVWHNQLPTWLTSMNNADNIRQAMIDHIEGVASYYRGKVIAWDVVNEAYEDDGQLRSSIWSQYLGDSFIDDAFHAAREADPEAILYYNDYDIESDYAKADAVYEMVAGLVERGVPIDGVGMQMHTRTTDEDPPIPEFEANLQRILALGLEVVLSEMDVRFCAGGTQEQQKTRFHDIIEVCLAYDGCKAVTIWGITDQYSFLNARNDLQCAGAEPPRPLLWDDDYNKKPAYDGVMDALLGR